MAVVGMNRRELLKLLNERFTEETIGKTAATVLQHPLGDLGRISEILGIIPASSLAAWHTATGSVPVLMAKALEAGIRGHLESLDQMKGPKALYFRIVDGPAFKVETAQQPTRTAITITMRNKPYKKKK
jgi:hypothetical protein